MKTFFTILTTITLLIGATLFYVVNDTSKVVFEPENLTESTTDEKEVPGMQPSTRDSIAEASPVKSDHNGEESGDPYDIQRAAESDFTRQNQQSTSGLSTQPDKEEKDEEKVQSEIRELRDDTHRILNKIIKN